MSHWNAGEWKIRWNFLAQTSLTEQPITINGIKLKTHVQVTWEGLAILLREGCVHVYLQVLTPASISARLSDSGLRVCASDLRVTWEWLACNLRIVPVSTCVHPEHLRVTSIHRILVSNMIWVYLFHIVIYMLSGYKSAGTSDINTGLVLYILIIQVE